MLHYAHAASLAKVTIIQRRPFSCVVPSIYARQRPTVNHFTGGCWESTVSPPATALTEIFRLLLIAVKSLATIQTSCYWRKTTLSHTLWSPVVDIPHSVIVYAMLPYLLTCHISMSSFASSCRHLPLLPSILFTICRCLIKGMGARYTPLPRKNVVSCSKWFSSFHMS